MLEAGSLKPSVPNALGWWWGGGGSLGRGMLTQIFPYSVLPKITFSGIQVPCILHLLANSLLSKKIVHYNFSFEVTGDLLVTEQQELQKV